MSSDPATPIRVPKAAGTYTPSTQDPELRSEINSILLKEGHINKIQETLLHALNASSTNWPTLVQEHALSLLRNGDCTTFPELIRQVMADIHRDTDARTQQDRSSKQSNGTVVNGKGSGERGASLALPKNVVEEGVRITREALDASCPFLRTRFPTSLVSRVHKPSESSRVKALRSFLNPKLCVPGNADSENLQAVVYVDE